VFNLWRLKRAERNAWDKFIASATIALAVPGEPHKDQTTTRLLERYELAEFKVKLYQSRVLVSCAESLDIVLSDTNVDYWETHKLYTHPILTPNGRYQARKLIDAEKARRFEVRTLWVTKIILPLAGVLVGIIGALTGLVAVLQHKK
jgi:hypothetical protein